MTPVERSVFLVGFMGSGKSAVGRLLAAALGRGFADTDDLVVEREGRPIERIFREAGEGHFRRVEWEALQSLAARPGIVAATGGGLFLGTLQRAWLRQQGITVWLDAPLEECLRRLGPAGDGRPLWAAEGDRLGFRALFERRRASYALARLRIGVGGPAREVARRVESRLLPFFLDSRA